MIRPRRATIAAVAKQAGVSTATVSRVLSGATPVSDDTKLRVEAAVESLKYRPSDLTRAVFAGRSNTIGVLIADMRSPYHVDLFDGISKVTGPTDTLSYLAIGGRDLPTERRILSLMDSHRFRGLITTASHESEDLVFTMADAGTECVYLTRTPGVSHPRIHSIRVDDIAAGQLAWEHLHSIGRTRILIVNLALNVQTIDDRTEGLVESARRSGVGIDPDNVFVMPSSNASEALRDRILQGHADGSIDAIFATTGTATFQVYEALSASGLDVPDDVAVLGMDNFAWADHLAWPLSVIAQPTVQMGSTATQLILEEPEDARHITLAPSLVVRASTQI